MDVRDDEAPPAARLPRWIAALALGVVAVAVATVGLAPTPASAARGPNPVDAIVAETRPYIVDDGAEVPWFDADAAARDGASPAVMLAGARFTELAAARAQAQSAEDIGEPDVAEQPDGDMVAMNGIPVWGNWCGPGHGGGTPVDTLDRLCQRHDLCYAQRGYFNCFCDAQLKAEIDRFAGQMRPAERAMAAAVKLAFSVGICNPF